MLVPVTFVGPVATAATSSPSSHSLGMDDRDSESTSDVRRLISSLDERMQGRELEITRIIAALLESQHPLLDVSSRQSIFRARSLADLNALVTVDKFPAVDHSGDIASLCVALAQPQRSNASLRRRTQAAFAGSVDQRHQLTATE